MKECRRMRERLISGDELKRAKENIKGSLMLGLEGTSSRMTHLANQEIYFGRFLPLEEILSKIDRIRAVELRRLANDIFDDSRLALIVLGSNNKRDFESMTLSL